ncbi:PRC-barrel domain-containing protein [Aureliella helgolandensis]|uniref:PRC-barrel domain protein n=1 Tax=Aureliella helgolandensis TaxID=2527968 RepID=A0A518G3G8_9BACT|nr:PRC-barrel domain-containing protein [Aureliella helgolandensis]QDV23146.1 PRC-barrel domain protein [Aureliella helgolandensis]
MNISVNRFGVWFPVALCGLSVLCVSPAVAQDGAPDIRQRQRGANQAVQGAGDLDRKAPGVNVRASKLMGMNIQNAQGESVGEVSDLVMDSRTGKINYLAVTYGGFLGIGNKMFAVPFGAFRCQPATDGTHDTTLILDVTPEQLEGAQGFDEESWPNFADRKFTQELNRRYGVQMPRRDRASGVDVDVNRNGVKVEVDGDR